MTASDTVLDDFLLAVWLITQRGEEPTAAAVIAMLPLGISAVDAQRDSIEARLLACSDDTGLTPAGRERLLACPARRALLSLLAVPQPVEVVA